MTPILFAANWKMHLGPTSARGFMQTFLQQYTPSPAREVWFFPPAVSLAAVSECVTGRDGVRAGAQDVYWEPSGAFTGQLSAPLAREAGAHAVLVGHSERRHLFGETDAETAKKVRAVFAARLTPVLCVGETLNEREAEQTSAVVLRQLEAALQGLEAERLSETIIAYEPVWAIGTGKTATPEDAAMVHAIIRRWLIQHRATRTRVLYGGSVKAGNVADLLAEEQIDGVLVGGASLDPAGWAAIAKTEPS